SASRRASRFSRCLHPRRTSLCSRSELPLEARFFQPVPAACDNLRDDDPTRSPRGRHMDETILGSIYSFTTFALLALLLVALLLARLITPVERLLITAAALLFAGVFFLLKPTHEPAFTLVAAATAAAGLWTGIRALRGWSRRSL